MFCCNICLIAIVRVSHLILKTNYLIWYFICTGHKDLKDKCPEDVRAMLEEKDLFDVYDKFVQTIVDTKNTRGCTGKWQDAQFISILDQFRDDFTAKGVKICFCKRKSGSKVGSYRWLEFIDVEALEQPYAPQFDVSNFSGQVIKTVYKKLQFPNGVAVEELKVSREYLVDI